MTRLYENIELLRKERRLSLRALQDQTGISKSAISKWKIEGSLPSLDSLLVLSDYFDVSLDYLLGRCSNRLSHKDSLRGTTRKIMQTAETLELSEESTDIIKLMRSMMQNA